MGYAFGVGREAPAFAARATDGNEIALAQYRGDWFPVIVFVPADLADGAAHLARLDAAASQLWGLRGQLIAVCEAPADEGAAFSGPQEVALPLLPDEGEIAAAYGALRPNGRFRRLAVIVDRAGKIVWTAEGADALDPNVIAVALREVAR